MQVAAAAVSNKPHLWLRMADCCMGVLQPQTDGAQLHSEHSSLASHIGANTSDLLAESCSVTVRSATLAEVSQPSGLRQPATTGGSWGQPMLCLP